jgi:hypothetical protein
MHFSSTSEMATNRVEYWSRAPQWLSSLVTPLRQRAGATAAVESAAPGACPKATRP